jgi:hypothetical protein
MTAQDIADLQGTKLFRDRYAKYLRKELLGPETMRQKLDDWFCKYKVTSSDNDSRRAGGRLDPIKQITLFTGDTKPAVENCKDKAQFLVDLMTLEYMYMMLFHHRQTPLTIFPRIFQREESQSWKPFMIDLHISAMEE